MSSTESSGRSEQKGEKQSERQTHSAKKSTENHPKLQTTSGAAAQSGRLVISKNRLDDKVSGQSQPVFPKRSTDSKRSEKCFTQQPESSKVNAQKQKQPAHKTQPQAQTQPAKTEQSRSKKKPK
uniref:(northern house mosquito) hypothetical protein n=1 Tax=Culex pipiens TaxID=7175 RepID=A0A8D8L666_CULPI